MSESLELRGERLHLRPMVMDDILFSNAKGNHRFARVKEKIGARLITYEPAKFVDVKYTEREIWELHKHE